MTVSVRDEFGDVVTDYAGTIHFSSNDPFPAVLPADYTFTTTDAGTRTFAGGVTFKTPGVRTVTVTDTARVQASPARARSW